jgi:membrane protein DedA with SNARE-associated domain
MPIADTLNHLIAAGGYWVVGTVVALESMGIPAPGETVLVTAAIYAGTTHDLRIGLVIAWAAAGAIVGDNLGFLIGRRVGAALLVRYAPLLRLNARRVKLGEYLFLRHGGKVVFFGRFIAVLRALAAPLAGVTGMDWQRFLFFNAAGGVVWATVYGLAAYSLGEHVRRLTRPAAILALVAGAAAVILFLLFVRRHEAELSDKAERALPGPFRADRRSGD